jgi:DNA-binding beta-propeller fold protein YncE
MRRVAPATVAFLLGACTPASLTSHRDVPAPDRSTTASPASTPGPTTTSPGFLAAGSDPSVLPGSVLIADRDNNRLVVVDPEGHITWQFPQPGDLAPGQSFLVPDDAFFTPDGQHILATQEEDDVVSLIDVRARRIVWQYGRPGTPGSGPGLLSNPDDAMYLPNGDTVLADIKNCRILVIPPQGQAPSRVIGETTQACTHRPPWRWGSPNGVFPMADGHYLVTEINGSWVDEITLAGQVLDQVHPPGVAYPSDANEASPGRWLVTDYSVPGQIVEFDPQGHLLWRYAPTGPAQLDKPSLALALPNGDVLCNDDFNHRVIVVDPRTDSVVWQYGHTGQAGSAPGYLAKPDGVDLAPPFSFLEAHAPTMGLP